MLCNLVGKDRFAAGTPSLFPKFLNFLPVYPSSDEIFSAKFFHLEMSRNKIVTETDLFQNFFFQTDSLNENSTCLVEDVQRDSIMNEVKTELMDRLYENVFRCSVFDVSTLKPCLLSEWL